MDVIANCTGTGHRRVSVDDNVCNNSVIGGGGGGPGRGEREVKMEMQQQQVKR